LTADDGDAAPFVLPSSPPTPCSEPVWFSYIAAGDVYLAEIDGYPQPSNGPYDPDGGLVPVPYAVGASAPGDPGYCTAAGAAIGVRSMCDIDTDLPVSPQWHASCPADANPDAGTVALANFDVILRGCALAEPQAPTAPAAIRILPSSVLGSYDCASLVTLDITVQGTTVYQWSRGAACAGGDAGVTGDAGAGADASAAGDAGAGVDAGACCPADVVTFSPGTDLAVDTPFELAVSALIAVDGGATAESTSCYATAKPNTSVLAVCDPLGPTG
jgi:hypothetical protein